MTDGGGDRAAISAKSTTRADRNSDDQLDVRSPGIKADTDRLLAPNFAREAIEALRDGTVPRSYASAYTVGRERYLQALAADLEFIGAGGYKVRFVVGDWGFGKTHLLALYGEAALARGFAVSHVELNARDAPLEKSEVITAAIIRSTIFPGGSAFEDYLRQWGRDAELRERAEIDRWLRESAPSLEFRALLREVLASGTSGTGAWDAVADSARWLTGGEPSPALSRSTGIRGAMKPRVAPGILTSFLTYLRASGSPGLILLLDEAEAITSLTAATRREEANQVLKRLLDNPEHRVGWEVVFATTRRFVDDPNRGARSYPALWERIRSASPSRVFNPRSTVLELDPLIDAELIVLGGHLRDLHAAAYGWVPRLGPDDFEQIAKVAYGEESRPPRRFVRAVVELLDILEADPNLSLADVISVASEFPADG